jgi:hypothetical protein
MYWIGFWNRILFIGGSRVRIQVLHLLDRHYTAMLCHQFILFFD